MPILIDDGLVELRHFGADAHAEVAVTALAYAFVLEHCIDPGALLGGHVRHQLLQLRGCPRYLRGDVGPVNDLLDDPHLPQSGLKSESRGISVERDERDETGNERSAHGGLRLNGATACASRHCSASVHF